MRGMRHLPSSSAYSNSVGAVREPHLLRTHDTQHRSQSTKRSPSITLITPNQSKIKVQTTGNGRRSSFQSLKSWQSQFRQQDITLITPNQSKITVQTEGRGRCIIPIIEIIPITVQTRGHHTNHTQSSENQSSDRGTGGGASFQSLKSWQSQFRREDVNHTNHTQSSENHSSDNRGRAAEIIPIIEIMAITVQTRGNGRCITEITPNHPKIKVQTEDGRRGIISIIEIMAITVQTKLRQKRPCLIAGAFLSDLSILVIEG